MMLLRAVPPELVSGVASGLYKITGSVVREVASGRGVGFLQESGALQMVLNSVMKSGGSHVGVFLNLAVGTASIVQNEQIKSRLAAVQSSLALVQNLQIGTLAVSGLGLGVSVAGFAVMLKRLKGIETHLGTIEAKIETITTDRRSDELRRIFVDVGTRLETVETLSARSSKVAVAEAAEQALAISAGQLESLFKQKSDTMQTAPVTPADMDMLWSLAAAIRLCHEAGSRALYTIDELEAAKQLAERRAQRFLDLSQTITPDNLARLCGQSAQDPKAYAEARRLALPQAEVLVQGLHDSVGSISSQAELADKLIEHQMSGSDYLKEIAAEHDAPLLMLPA